MKTFWRIVALLIGFIPNANSTTIQHPVPIGDDSQSVVYELLGRGCFGVDMKEIKLKNGQFTMVSKVDYGRLSKFNWTLDADGYVSRYFKLKGKLICVKMHREVMRAARGQMVDHRRHNLLDNRRSSLRFCDYTTNGRNRIKQKKPASSKFKGVCFLKKIGRWQATICTGKSRNKWLGNFDTETEAAISYNRFAKKIHGRFALLNQIC